MIMVKKRWIAISCTTLEALTNCIADQCSVICVEEPLYSQFKDLLEAMDGIAEYRITDYDSMQFSMLIKVQGTHTFDRNQYEVYYYPLHGI